MGEDNEGQVDLVTAVQKIVPELVGETVLKQIEKSQQEAITKAVQDATFVDKKEIDALKARMKEWKAQFNKTRAILEFDEETSRLEKESRE